MTNDRVDRILTEWDLERPELDTRALALSARIVRLDRFLDRIANDVLADYGLNHGEVNVLAALRRSGAPYRLTPTDLYKGLLLSSGAMTNRLDRLEAAGFVVRDRDKADRRRILVGLTDVGLKLIDEIMDVHTAALNHWLGEITEDRREQLADGLRELLIRLEKHYC